MTWYEYTQNNTFGEFEVNENLAHRVFIEAENENEAERKALSLGIYFDGCDKGIDCSCCGDRWYSPDTVDLKRLSKSYGVDFTIVSYAQYLANKYGWTEPDAIIYFSNGKIERVYKKDNEVNVM